MGKFKIGEEVNFIFLGCLWRQGKIIDWVKRRFRKGYYLVLSNDRLIKARPENIYKLAPINNSKQKGK